jgi:ribosomal protein L29
MTTLYDTDFYLWTQDQAALLREGKVQALDLNNLAEEIESLGKSQRHELEHRLDGLFMHLLKWRYQPSRRQSGHSWRSTIREHRRSLARLLRDNPSLRREVPAFLDDSYVYACEAASDETGLPLATFPAACPWTPEQVLNPDFWPEEDAA